MVPPICFCGPVPIQVSLFYFGLAVFSLIHSLILIQVCGQVPVLLRLRMRVCCRPEPQVRKRVFTVCSWCVLGGT